MSDTEERFVTEGYTYEPEVRAWIKTRRCSCSFCDADTIEIDIIERVDPDPEQQEGEE